MVQKSELRGLVLEEIERLNHVLRVELAIPESISANDIASFFYAQLASDRLLNIDSGEGRDDLEIEFKLESKLFQLISDQLPGISSLLLKQLSLAVGGLSMQFDMTGRFSPHSHGDAISTIMLSAYIRGITSQNRSMQQAELAALVRSAVGRSGGDKKNEPYRPAKEFVQKEWVKNRSAYGDNKSAFARDYAPRVSHEFADKKGHPVKVTEKTIKEVWLKDTPSAGKPAG